MSEYEILMNVIDDRIRSATTRMNECMEKGLMGEMLFWNIISNTCCEIVREFGMRCAGRLAEEGDKRNEITNAIARGSEIALANSDKKMEEQ